MGVGGPISVVVSSMLPLICCRLTDCDAVCWVEVTDNDVTVCFVVCSDVIFGVVVGTLDVICSLDGAIVVVLKRRRWQWC